MAQGDFKMEQFAEGENTREKIKNKLRQNFDGKIVRKDLTKKIKEGANVPVYVLEFLLGQYCSSDDEAVIETACFVSRDGIKPLNLKNYPTEVIGLISAVKNYESLTVEAALTGDYDTALKAMLAHPLIREYDIAKPLLDEMLEAHKDYLPQFFKK